jgi:hypothetical protein
MSTIQSSPNLLYFKNIFFLLHFFFFSFPLDDVAAHLFSLHFFYRGYSLSLCSVVPLCGPSTVPIRVIPGIYWNVGSSAVFFFSSFFCQKWNTFRGAILSIYTFATNSIIVPVIEGEKGGRTQKKERKKGKSRYLIRYSFFFSPDDYLY